MAMHAKEKIEDEDFTKVVRALASYLPTAEDYEDLDDMEALKRVREREGV